MATQAISSQMKKWNISSLFEVALSPVLLSLYFTPPHLPTGNLCPDFYQGRLGFAVSELDVTGI